MLWLNNISIKWRILMSFFFFLLVFIAFGTFSLFEMKTLFNLTQKLYDHPFTVSNAAQRANTGVIRIHRTMKDVSTATNSYELQQAMTEVRHQERLVYQNLDIVKNNILGLEGKELVQETIELFAGWEPIRETVIDLVAADRYEEARDITKNKGADYVNKLEHQMAELSEYAHAKAKGFLKDALYVWQGIAVLIILLIIIVTLTFIFILTVVLRSINQNISNLVDTMSLIQTTGNLKKAEIVGTNEISDLSSHFNNLIERLESQIWQRDGLNSFNEELSGEQDYSKLLQKGINFICRFVEACVGAIYSYSEKEQCSKLVSSYAFVERQYISNQFRNGEGIVGQVALEKTPILLKNIRRNEAEAVSGTSAEAPKHIYALPLLYEGSLLGVLEVASFTEIDKGKREVLDECGKIMSTFANAARQNQKVQELYSITQQANKDLENKTAELNTSNEQLSTVNRELQVQADELKVQKSELERQRQQVQEADRLKSEFLSNMSHELRTPLNSVLALSQLMIRQGTGKNTEKEHEYLHVIERNGRRLLSLINDILDLSKIEADRVDLEISQFSVSAVIDRINETITPLLNTDRVKLEFNVEEKLHIVSDERKVQQIMLNLVSNAVKFTESGSIKLKVFKKNNELHWSVEDTGIGIGAEEMDNIFSEFRQVDGSLSRMHEGTGLGLAISRKLAEKLGGTINVESKKGKGSIFTLQLPQNIKADSDYELSQPEVYNRSLFSRKTDPNWIRNLEQKGSKPIILVIDDDEEILSHLQKNLTGAGYNVFSAGNGKDGLNYARTLKPSLIVLDVLMPEMDGFEVIRELKTDKSTESIPVIIISVSDDKETGMALGASRFLTKPVDYERLLNEIKTMLPGVPNPRILVVDDDPIIRKQLTGLLNERQYISDSVVGGAEAVESVVLKPPDLVILDLLMPETDGFSVLKQIRRNPRTRDIPVLVLTAKDLTKKDKEDLARSVHNVLTKGKVDNLALLKLVEESIRKLPTGEIISEKKPVLLIVEDNEAATLQIRSILEEENYSFLMASSGMEAIKILEHNVPDAVILDLMMPEIDGFQVLKHLRLSATTQKTPVLVLTAKELTKQDRERLVYNDVQELIQKGSVNKDQLLNAINGLFEPKPEPDSEIKNPVKQKLVNKGKPVHKEPTDCKLLIVEDNPDNLVTIEAILDSLSYNYISVAQGEKALDLMKLESPDLVLMDIQLPGLSGIDTIKMVRKEPGLSNIPVICLTAKAMKGDKESLLKEGFDDYISKPLDPDDVRVVLKKWIKRPLD